MESDSVTDRAPQRSIRSSFGHLCPIAGQYYMHFCLPIGFLVANANLVEELPNIHEPKSSIVQFFIKNPGVPF
jgi:hypothetical protein